MLIDHKTTTLLVLLVVLAGCSGDKPAVPSSALATNRDAIGSVTLTVTPGTSNTPARRAPRWRSTRR